MIDLIVDNSEDVSRELYCSEAECFKCSLDVRLCVGDDGDVSSACRRFGLDLLGVSRSPFISGFVGKCEPAIVAGSDMCVLAVVAVSSYGWPLIAC